VILSEVTLRADEELIDTGGTEAKAQTYDLQIS